ncbi:hypothetical protein pb186bvf_018922 [Paramecium bursaria]
MSGAKQPPQTPLQLQSPAQIQNIMQSGMKFNPALQEQFQVPQNPYQTPNKSGLLLSQGQNSAQVLSAQIQFQQSAQQAGLVTPAKTVILDGPRQTPQVYQQTPLAYQQMTASSRKGQQ